MYVFKKELKSNVLKGRTARYVAHEILDIHEMYLYNILNGNMGCSKRLAKQITKLASVEANINDYFMIKEK